MDELTSYFSNLARMAKTDEDKIVFFNENQRAFFLDPDALEFGDAIKKYCENCADGEEEVQKLSNKLEDMKWLEMPDPFKIFAFNFCILEGGIYID